MNMERTAQYVVLHSRRHMILRQRWLSRRKALRRPTPSQPVRSSGSQAGSCHPVVYHEDFALSPLPDRHRFPMPKDHLLFCSLRERGWAARTFRPVPPDVDTLSLVRLCPAPTNKGCLWNSATTNARRQERSRTMLVSPKEAPT